jgi:UDP-N-acetylmuramate--alanine ligase
VADVYTAGEQPIPGADRDGLVEGLRMRGHRQVLALPGADALPEMVHDLTQPGDFVVCLGAGNITAWANALPGELDRLNGLDTKKTASGGQS